MANVNKVTVMGVLGRDPETKQFPNGGSITTFSVATTEFWKDKATGERKSATEWHRIATSNRLAEIASKYLKKGSKVYVEGSMRTRKYKDQSGADREVTEIRADILQLL
jgi:single-strand DNA-binding protein